MWRRLAFAAARENLHAAARDGIGAQLLWPGRGQVAAVRELVLERAAAAGRGGPGPLAHRPARARPVPGHHRGRGPRTGRNGAVWQLEQVRHLEERRGLNRGEALAAMVPRYAELARDGDPVHTWPVG